MMDSASVLYRIESCSDGSAVAVVLVVLVVLVSVGTFGDWREFRTSGQAGCSRLGLAPPELTAAATKPISKLFMLLLMEVGVGRRSRCSGGYKLFSMQSSDETCCHVWDSIIRMHNLLDGGIYPLSRTHVDMIMNGAQFDSFCMFPLASKLDEWIAERRQMLCVPV